MRKQQFNIHVWIYQDSIQRLFPFNFMLITVKYVIRQGMTDGQTRSNMARSLSDNKFDCNLEWGWTSARLGFTKWNEMAPNRKGGGVFYKWYGKNNKLDSSESRTSTHKRKGKNLNNFRCTFWPLWVKKECIQNGIWKATSKGYWIFGVDSPKSRTFTVKSFLLPFSIL